jgi:hypothetical protein
MGRTITFATGNGDACKIQLGERGWQLVEVSKTPPYDPVRARHIATCARCGVSVDVDHGRYYSDVPGVGDLCVRCWDEWYGIECTDDAAVEYVDDERSGRDSSQQLEHRV